MYVCLCTGATTQAVADAVASGATTCNQVAAHCGAGLDCGRCRRTVQAVHAALAQKQARLEQQDYAQTEQTALDAVRTERQTLGYDVAAHAALRQQVATQLSGVQSVLDGLLVDRPRRNILRKPR